MAAEVLPAATDYRVPGALRGVDFLHAESYAALAIDFEHLDANFVAFAELVADFLDSLGRNLRNVHEAIASRQNGYERTKVHQLGNFALVDLADFDVCRDQLNATDSFFASEAVDARPPSPAI